MQLSEYLKRNEMTAARFAEKIGVARESVRRYAAGERFPRPAILRRISQATGGAVDYPDFLARPAEEESA